MIDQKFIDRIEELRHNTYSRITDLQKNLSPTVRRRVYMNFQFEYWYDGYKYNVWEDDTHVYAVNELPYCYDNEIGNTTFIDTLDNLVEQEKMWPFLLFINGQVIPWSDITVIHDYDYSYIKVGDFGPDESFYTDLLVFPMGKNYIRYGEDGDIQTGVVNRKGYYFDSDRKRIESVDFADVAIRLEILNDNIYYKEVNVTTITDGILRFTDLPTGFIPSLDNIVLFDSDGLFVHDEPSTYIEDSYNGNYGMFKLKSDLGKVKWAILTYNTAHTKSKGYLYSKEDLSENSMRSYISNNSPTDSLPAKVLNKFDFAYDKLTDYETNINNAAKYITKYDFRLWKEAFNSDLPIKIFSYTGKEYKAMSDDKGYIHMSRKHSDRIQDVVMVFVNSNLYDYSIDISYTNNTINIPIFGILDEDHVEIIMFTECNNLVLDLNIESSSEDVYINPAYDPDDCYIMSETCSNPAYTVPDSDEGRKQYIVDFTYTRLEEEGHYNITFSDEYYYEKDLKIVPKKQFRHYRFKQKDSQFKLILPTSFNYCHDPNRYMIFVNGRKIDKTEYTITIMNPDRPFDQLVLYLSTILDAGDYVDIFYLPMIITEKYKIDQIENSGLMVLTEPDDYPKTYPLSKDTTMVFINGQKVNCLDIKDIDINKMLIFVDKYQRNEDGSIKYLPGKLYPETNNFNIKSIYNVTVCEYIDGDKYIGGYLDGLYEQIVNDDSGYDPSKIDFTVQASDGWKSIITELGVDNLSTFYGAYYSLENPESDYKNNFTDLKSIVYDIIVDYYMTRSEASAGEQFVYDFERPEWEPYSRYTDPTYEEDDSTDVIKWITLFGERDKLLDYIVTDAIASTDDVLEGKTFYSAEV